MKAAPEKIYLEREKETDRMHYLWGRTPVISSLYEHIEYARTDAFIEKACDWLRYDLSEYFDDTKECVLVTLKKYMMNDSELLLLVRSLPGVHFREDNDNWITVREDTLIQVIEKIIKGEEVSFI